MKGGNSQPSMKTRIVESALCRRPVNVEHAGVRRGGRRSGVGFLESGCLVKTNVPAGSRVRTSLNRTSPEDAGPTKARSAPGTLNEPGNDSHRGYQAFARHDGVSCSGETQKARRTKRVELNEAKGQKDPGQP